MAKNRKTKKTTVPELEVSVPGPPAAPLAPVLEVVRELSVDGLDDLQLAIAAEHAAQYPPLQIPETISYERWLQVVGRAS